MKIVHSKIDKGELGSVFDFFKTYMKPVIDDAFGWDEEFQRKEFESHYESEWFSWVFCGEEKVGLVCSRFKENSLHIHLIIIFSQVQRRGIASSVVCKFRAEAHAEQLDITLSCFKNNTPAVSLYEKLGFVVLTQDEYFYDFISSAKST
jgi:ribosomal protein S18 acetylase RimI-like enzyme